MTMPHKEYPEDWILEDARLIGRKSLKSFRKQSKFHKLRLETAKSRRDFASSTALSVAQAVQKFKRNAETHTHNSNED